MGRFYRYRYFIAVASVLIAYAVKRLVGEAFYDGSPFLFFFTAVVISAWMGGLRPGLLATALSTFVSAFFLPVPLSSFIIGNDAGRLAWAFFAVEGALVSALFEQVHKSRLKLRDTVQEAQEARKLAEESSQAKRSFIANMSHEIRTPLSSILGFTELILKPDITTNERQKYLPKVQANVRALSMLIDDILEISAIERGGLEVERSHFSLMKFLRDLNEEMKPLGEQKGVRLEFRAKGFLPPELETDQRKLHQILMHTINNAIKATQGDLVTVTAVLRKGPCCKKTIGGMLAFVISGDPARHEVRSGRIASGPGIETADDVSVEFGMPLARRLCKALGGDIRRIRPQDGFGSTFLVEVPVSETPEFQSNFHEVPIVSMPTSQVREVDSESSPLAGVKVLLVEDSPDNRFLVSRFLDLAGAQVETAKNGQEGVDMASAGDYNVVVMDIQMPVLDGNRAAQELRFRHFKKPIIALSAHALKEDQVNALHSGFNDYLVKPVKRRDLIDKVQRYARESLIPPAQPAWQPS